MRKQLRIAFILMFACPYIACARTLVLFSEEERAFYPGYLCDFLEHYLGECMDYNNPDVSLPQKMRDDKVVIIEGDLNNLQTINDSTSFALIRNENSCYEVRWEKGHRVLLHIAFPIQYDLLLGKNIAEIEQSLYDSILASPLYPTDSLYDPFMRFYALDSISKDSLYIQEDAGFYYLPSVNDKRYYTKDTAGTYHYVISHRDRNIVLTNALLLPTPLNPPIEVQQRLYGFKVKEFSITLQQWVAYCLHNNLRVYVAMEEETDNALRYMLIAHSAELEYNHIVSLLVPIKANTDEPVPCYWQATISAFIPTHNIKNLYK